LRIFHLFQIDSQYYKAYKKTYAIVLQAVYDASVKFTNCFAGFFGFSWRFKRMSLDIQMYGKKFKWINNPFFPMNLLFVDKAYPVLVYFSIYWPWSWSTAVRYFIIYSCIFLVKLTSKYEHFMISSFQVQKKFNTFLSNN